MDGRRISKRKASSLRRNERASGTKGKRTGPGYRPVGDDSEVKIIHVEGNAKEYLCDTCATNYSTFCKEKYEEPPKFCTCEECINDSKSTREMRCSFCGCPIIFRSLGLLKE